MSQLLILSILIQINPRPSTKQRKRTINRSQTAEILKLLDSLLLRLTEDRTKKRKELDTMRITSILTLCKLPDLPDVLRYYSGTVTRHKDSFRMLRGEGFACF